MGFMEAIVTCDAFLVLAQVCRLKMNIFGDDDDLKKIVKEELFQTKLGIVNETLSRTCQEMQRCLYLFKKNKPY